MSVAALNLMGEIAILTRDGVRMPLGLRARLLLAILTIEDGRHSREEIARQLWSDRGRDQRLASLRQCLNELRRTFDRHEITWPLVVSNSELAMDRNLISCDAVALQQAIISSDIDEVAAAIETVGNRPILGHIEAPGEMTRWVAVAQARFDAMVSSRIAELLDGSAEGVAMESAMAVARQRLKSHPHCAIASAFLAKSVQNGAVPQPRVLTPLPLPADAPPAVLVEPLGLSNDCEEVSALGLAIREDIVAALARFREMRVVDVGAEATGSRADAGYSLALTLRTAGGGLMVIARLTAIPGGDVLWGYRGELHQTGVQEAVDRLVDRVVAAVAPTINRHLLRINHQRPTGALYAQYLAMRASAQRPKSYANAQEVAEELEAIIVQAPGFASAKLALARLYNTDFAWTRAMSSTDLHRQRALELARAAVAIDPGLAHGHSLLGWCYLRRHDWAAARRFLEEAARLNPYHVRRLMEVAFGMLHLGDQDLAESLLRRCLGMNPDGGDGFYFDLGMLALVRGDPLVAADHLAMIADPDPWARLAGALAAIQSGLSAEDPIASARSAIAELWPNGVLPSFPVIEDWVTTRHPFRFRTHREMFMQGLKQVFP